MLWIRLAMVTALVVHHPSAFKALASTANSTSTGFSFRLVANNAIRRHDDGFQHLQTTSSLLGLHTETDDSIYEPLQNLQAMAVTIGTGRGMQSYILKVDRVEHDMSWIQCVPCTPCARQHNPLFIFALSPTCHHIPSTSSWCVPPYSSPHGQLCAFRLTGSGGLLVTGFLEQDQLSDQRRSVMMRDFVFGCAHSTTNFQSEGVYAGVISLGRSPASLVMQAAARGLTQFSYCLVGGSSSAKRHGYLRFGSDVVPHNPRYRTTRILPSHQESEYHLSLIGVSLGGQKLDGIRPEMFARSKDQQTGGCVIDISTPLTVVAQEAYNIIEEALWSDLQQHRQKVERVRRPGFGLCFRAPESSVEGGFLKSLSLHFSEEEAVLVFSPKQLFLMMEEGQVACLAMKPGNRTVIGAFQQVDTRFVYDVEDSKLSFAPELCTLDTVQAD
jgi:aspartyl protease family protein